MKWRLVYVVAKNIPKQCLPVKLPVEVDLLQELQLCLRLYDLFTPGEHLHICVALDILARDLPLLELQIICLQIGRDGVTPNTYLLITHHTGRYSTLLQLLNTFSLKPLLKETSILKYIQFLVHVKAQH